MTAPYSPHLPGQPSRSHSDEVHVPRGPLLAAALLISATLLGVGWVRSSGVDVSTRSQAAVVKQRVLQFEDMPDGGVRVLDMRAGQAPQLVQVVAPGEGGFLRGAMRALVRHRRLASVGAEAPFTLTAHADGRLTLADPATGQRLDLESFGPTNAAVFARLLDAGATGPNSNPNGGPHAEPKATAAARAGQHPTATLLAQRP